jgi:hypothetical protein
VIDNRILSMVLGWVLVIMEVFAGRDGLALSNEKG